MNQILGLLCGRHTGVEQKVLPDYSGGPVRVRLHGATGHGAGEKQSCQQSEIMS